MIQIPPALLHQGDNVIAIAVRRGFGGHGCCLKLQCGGKAKAMNILSAPGRSEKLPFETPEPGKEFTIPSSEKENGFSSFTCILPGAECCTLYGDSGRTFTENGADVPYRVNAYSGAEIPVLRSDEMLSEGERFSFFCGGWEFSCLSREAIGMYFADPHVARLVFCIRNTPLKLRITKSSMSSELT